MGKRKSKKGLSEADELEVLKRQLLKARTKGDFKEVSNLHNQMGVLYRELRSYDEAIQEHEEEAAITRKYFPNDKVGLGIAYRAQAEVHLETKDEEKALPLIKDYLHLATEANDIIEEQRAHVTLGRAYIGFATNPKYTEEESYEVTKDKALRKAENEFEFAKDLCNHSKLKALLNETDLMDMKCGVYYNLAVVMDLRGNADYSDRYLQKVIELAKKYSFHQHLYRSYLNLYEVNLKKESYREAMKYTEEAAKVAKILNDVVMEAEAKIFLAKLHFLTNELEAGIKALKKIRKFLKAKDVGHLILEEIDPILKSAVRIVRSEDELHLLDVTNFDKRRKLYEIMADNFVELGCFNEAVTYYELALENAKKINIIPGELAKLYYSIAITFKDKGDYISALKYFDEEIKQHDENYIEAFKTQTNIVACMEKAKLPVEEILSGHEKALLLAEECNSPKKELAALMNYSIYLKIIKREEERSKIQEKIDQIKATYGITDAEDDSQDLLDGSGDMDVDINESIDLDNLTSDEDVTDEEDEKDKANEVITKKKKFRVNEKGETPLHVAAKKGDLKLVRRLIRQGHEINPRDSAGWIPLHEASNFGHVEVVEELLKHGARVNDQPSGVDCDRITPIHDAANNGHLAVMKALIKYGANVLLKDAKGNYPIDCLIFCRETLKASGEEIPREDLEAYYEVKDMLKSMMAKGGKHFGKEEEKKAKRKAKKICIDDEPKFELMGLSRNSGETPIPVTVAVDDFDPDDANAAVDFYSDAMSNLRRRNKRRRANSDGSIDDSISNRDAPSGQDKTNALIAESQYIDDDWLEDDLGPAGKQTKRKRDPLEDMPLVERPTRRRNEGSRNDVVLLDTGERHPCELERPSSSSRSQKTPKNKKGSTSPKKSCSSSRILTISDDSNSTDNEVGFQRQRSFHEPDFEGNQNSLSSFVDLLDEDVGHSHVDPFEDNGSKSPIVTIDDSDSSDSLDNNKYRRLSNKPPSFSESSFQRGKKSDKQKGRLIQPKLPFKRSNSSTLETVGGSQGRTSQAQPAHTPNLEKSVLRLKIRIGDKLFVVPVLDDQANGTIDWLCEECAKRYFESNGIKPILTLSTKDGAILSGTDIINVVLGDSETELLANIVSYDLPRLPDRFRTTQSKTQADIEDEGELMCALEVCQSSNVLMLTDYSLRGNLCQILFQSLQCQFLLSELHLSSCSLFDQGVKSLANILHTLPRLTLLDLSCNGITVNSIVLLSESLRKKPENMPLMPNSNAGIRTLNLSYNALGNSAGATLADLLSQMPFLSNLSLSDCDFTGTVFRETRLISVLTRLNVDNLDLSYNDWGDIGLDLIKKSFPQTVNIVIT